MNWFQSTNAKEIGTLYLIFAVFAGMLGTAFSVLIRLELSSPGVQFLQGDHQLFNGAPFNFIVRSDSNKSQGLPNPLTLTELKSLKASTLASLGQLNGENSIVEKLTERMLASYISHDEDNESLQPSTLVEIPGFIITNLSSYIKHHNLDLLLYVETTYLIWSDDRVARSNLKEGRHLKETNGGQYKNSGSPDRRKF
jgi:hypothetical protein